MGTAEVLSKSTGRRLAKFPTLICRDGIRIYVIDVDDSVKSLLGRDICKTVLNAEFHCDSVRHG